MYESISITIGREIRTNQRVFLSSSLSMRTYQRHVFLWQSLSINPYEPVILKSPKDNIQCPLKADKCKFLLVDQLWEILTTPPHLDR